MFERGLVLRCDAPGSEAAAAEVFAACGQHEEVFAFRGVNSHRDVLAAVVLELLVASSVAVDFDVPDGFVESRAVELLAPAQGVAFRRGVNALACPGENRSGPPTCLKSELKVAF